MGAAKTLRRPPETFAVTTLEEVAAIARAYGYPLQREAYEFAVSAMTGALVNAATKVASQIGRQDLRGDIHSEAVICLWGLLRSCKPGSGGAHLGGCGWGDR